MIDLGRFALFFAFLLALYGLGVSVLGAKRRHGASTASALGAGVMLGVLLSVASAALIYALVTRDFSLQYVASYTSRDLSLVYTLSAFYGGLAGSLLFWVWVLSLMVVVVIVQNERRPSDIFPYVLPVLLTVLTFFLALTNFSSNPFELAAQVPADGRGLNPLLQNPGMFFHPPTLYLGYIGFTVPFAFAIGALLAGKVGNEWVSRTRNWTLFAWFFLGIGNLFGSWWAYNELGWGGFWMWDPVENASFMPWLTGTAFLHSVMIQEKKGMLKVWNMALIMATFSLTLFGTFLTRSGVITSVHSFAQASVGPLLLGFMGVVLFGSLSLLVWRLPLLKSAHQLDSFISRESSFLFNNLLLVGGAFAVLWGTIFPLISEAVRGVKLTVGPPFFNQVMAPIFLAMLLLTGICPLIAWRKATARNLRRNLVPPALLGGLALLGMVLGGLRDPFVVISFGLAAFVGASIIIEFYRGTRARQQMKGAGWAQALIGLFGRNRRRYGGYVIHLGVLMMVVGITGSAFQTEHQAGLLRGESLSVREYRLQLDTVNLWREPGKEVLEVTLSVWRGGTSLGTLKPRKEYHFRQEQSTTEVAVRSTLKEDLYVILAEMERDRIVVKAVINPLISWLWLGGLGWILGTLITGLPVPELRGARAPSQGRQPARDAAAPALASPAAALRSSRAYGFPNASEEGA
ncbi:MAG: heme lyase CcmF/NrfE family subunit [Candidatus Tectomicrobia bacterium]|nr:heme lyase CcmF/NrfE family subunit [Candidatus Tectomicrobia bacterium]